MHEQIKKRLKELEKKYPSLSEFTDVTVTFSDGHKETVMWSSVIQMNTDDIDKIEGCNQDAVNLLYALMGVDMGLKALE